MTPHQESLVGRYIDTEYGHIVQVDVRKAGRGWVCVVWPREDQPATVFRPADVTKAIDLGQLAFAPDITLSDGV